VLKIRPNDTFEKYKTRLVAKGNTFKEGEDYFDTNPHVAWLTIIWVLLSVVASCGIFFHEMDAKTTFLNGELKETW
jgi:hypothetical protein